MSPQERAIRADALLKAAEMIETKTRRRMTLKMRGRRDDAEYRKETGHSASIAFSIARELRHAAHLITDTLGCGEPTAMVTIGPDSKSLILRRPRDWGWSCNCGSFDLAPYWTQSDAMDRATAHAATHAHLAPSRCP